MGNSRWNSQSYRCATVTNTRADVEEPICQEMHVVGLYGRVHVIVERRHRHMQGPCPQQGPYMEATVPKSTNVGNQHTLLTREASATVP